MPNLMSLFYLAVCHFFAEPTVGLTRLVCPQLFTRFLPDCSEEQQRWQSKPCWLLLLFLASDPEGRDLVTGKASEWSHCQDCGTVWFRLGCASC